jgi:predicted Zn finger-like uncharacterized protein
MIITCNNCSKKFNIDSNVIPEDGRLLQCSACNYKWFFKKEIIEKSVPIVKIKVPVDETAPQIRDVVQAETETTELFDGTTQDVSVLEKKILQKNDEKEELINDDDKSTAKSTNKKSYNILGITIIFIISFIALIIVLDTFQVPISKFVPNIEFLLYSLYETINDIVLFLSDLI